MALTAPRRSLCYPVVVREPLNRAKLQRFLEAFGREAKGPGRVYLTGGATAVTYGWRTSTLDVDLRLDPEPAGAFEAIARLKDRLDVNVELASPADFLPEVPGWRERSVFVARCGPVDVYHYDPVSQVLAKLARGHERDLADAEAMVAAGLTTRAEVGEGFAAIRSGLVRFPRMDAGVMEARVAEWVSVE
jgi:hypothetical protein